MKRISLFLSLFVLLGLCFGCQSDQGGTTAPTSNADRELKMTMMSGTDISTLDPLKCIGSTSWLVVHSLYDFPWVLDLDFNIHYRCATGYTISDDGLEYTITIRDDVVFHNGAKMTAEDFAYTINTANQCSIYTSWAKHIVGAEVVDEKTVKMTLSQPFSPMINMMQNLAILPKDAHEAAGGDFGYNPVGCGPYKLSKYDVGDKVLLEAFGDYYGEPAAIKKVSYKLIPESSTVSIALQNKEIDFSSNFAKTDMDKLVALDFLQLKTQPVQSFNYVTYNMTIAPFDNALFRQAINYAVNREAMIQMGAEGYGAVGNGVVNELVFGYKKTDGWDYNPEKAAELLAEAGYPNGEGVPTHTIYCYGATTPKLAQIFQENLKALGIDWPIEEADMNLVWEYQETGQAAISFDGMGLGTDPSEYANMLETGGGFNTAFYSNPVVDDLFRQGGMESDPEKRKELYGQIWDIYQEDAPYMVLYYSVATIICSNDLDLSKADTFGLYGSSNILPYYLSWK